MLWFIENRKKEFDDEKVPMPVIWGVVIAIVVITGLVIGICKLTDVMDRHEMRQQYGNQYEEVM